MLSRRIAWNRAYLLLIAASAAWGVGTIISKRALEEIPPLALLPIQLICSLVLLTGLLARNGWSFRDPALPVSLERLGILNPGLSYALGLLGLVSISASLAVLIWATEPLLILLLAGWLLRERLTVELIALSMVAAVGVALVVYVPSTTGEFVGVGLTFAGVLCCAIYSTASRRLLITAEQTVSVVAVQQVYALAFAVVLATAAWFMGGRVLPVSVTPVGAASAAGSGILYYGLAYWMFLSALRQMPASVAAASFYLIPIFGLIASYVLLGERLTDVQTVGASVVLLAVLGIARLASVGATVAPEMKPHRESVAQTLDE